METKNDNQLILFDIIRKALPANLTLAGVVSDLLGLSMNTTYTRIRGEKPLSLEEAVLLCRRFGISFDSIIATADTGQIPCSYTPMLDGNTETYCRIICAAAEKFEQIAAAGSEMSILATVDIPPFHVFMYPELTMFRHFSWSHLFGSATSYEEFIARTVDDKMRQIYSRMEGIYRQMPSVEVWTVDTIGTLLQFLTYHCQMRNFADSGSALTLCAKLTELMDTMEKWATTGTKGPDGPPFKLYISEIDVGNTFVLFKNANRLRCWIRLFTMHGLVFSNETLCREVENWMNRSLQRATLISGASAVERYKFFDGQRQKISAFARNINRREG